MGSISDPKSLWAGQLHNSPKPQVIATLSAAAVLIIGIILLIPLLISKESGKTIDGREVQRALRDQLTSRTGAAVVTSLIRCPDSTFRSGDVVRCTAPARSVSRGTIDLLVTVTWDSTDWNFYVDVK